MADKIVTQDPTKPGQAKVNGPTLVNNLVPLAGLDGTGAILNSVIAFNGATWVPSAATPSADTASNLGAGAQVFKSKVGADFQFRSLIATGGSTATQNANDITINSVVETASNLGAGTGVFSAKVGVDFQFKTLLAGANITLTPTGTDITIAAGAGSFTPSFTSSEQTIINSTTLTVAHGLASIPNLVIVVIRCKTAQLGFAIGDEIQVSGYGGDVNNIGAAAGWNTTNVVIQTSQNGIYLIDSGGGWLGAAITNGNWRYVIRAWL